MKKLLLLATVITTVLPACQNKTGASSDYIISSIEANQNGKISKIFLTYGNNGAITRLDIGSQHSTTNFSTYTYQQGKITVYSQEESVKNTTHYTLDPSNKIVFAQDDQVKGAFKYDREGYLIESTITFPKSSDKLVFKCFYTDGNLTKITERHSTDTTSIYIYYSSEPAVDLLGFENPLSYYNYALYDFCDGVLIREGYFGKKSKNIMKSGASSSSTTDNNYDIALSYTNENDKITALKYNSDLPMEYKLNYMYR